MIRLRRPNVIPPTLRAGGPGGLLAQEHERRRREDVAAELVFDPHWQKLDVHGALLAMQGWVCAYCQTRIRARDKKYVDHFRPKRGVYWWLAYAHDNYFLTCGQCNERKGDRFPIEAGGCRVTFETRDARKTEPRLLINLVDDPVDEWLVVDVDEDGDRYAEIVPREEFDPFSEEAFRISETIELFALNDDDDLLQERVRALDRLTGLHRAGKLDQLRKRASRYCRHSLTARSFLETYVPELVPDATRELQWFMGRLCRRLLSILDRRERRGRKSDALVRRASEIAWTLAYLWKDPPVDTAEDVARFLEQKGCKKRVQRYYVKLGAGEPAPEPEGC